MSSSLPSTYCQWQLPKVGSGIESLKLVKDISMPKPKRGQVLVRIRATSMNYHDLLTASQSHAQWRNAALSKHRLACLWLDVSSLTGLNCERCGCFYVLSDGIEGEYPTAMPDNSVPLSDGAGEVAAVGDDVTEFKVGDRVAAIYTPKWQDGDNRSGVAYSGSVGSELPGLLSQYVLLDATAVVALPANVSNEEGAALPCAGVTAWNALLGARIPLKPDHSVLVMGTGGVSLIAAQIARAHGARVIATSFSDDKIAKLISLGLVKKGDTINYKKTPEWGKEVKRLSGRGVDHVVEIGGQGTIQQSIEAVGPDGEISLIGIVSGNNAGGGGVDPMKVLGGGFSMRGFMVGHRRHFQDLLAMYERNPDVKINSLIDEKIFSFDQVQEAYKYLESGAHFGKIIIRVD